MSLLDRPVRDFLAEVAAPVPRATGGAVSAMTAAAAAGLCAMVAGIHGAEAARTQAERARAAAGELVDADGEAYAAVMAARRLPADAPERTEALHDALRSASEPPLRLCRVAADVARLAADLAGQVRGGLRGDAVTAADLASAATRGAAGLVRLNHTAAGDGPGSYAEATDLAAAAATHADAAHERLGA